MSQLFVQIYKLSHTLLRTKASVVKVKHDSHRLTEKSDITVNLSRAVESTRKRTAAWCYILLLCVAQCTLVKCNAFW